MLKLSLTYYELKSASFIITASGFYIRYAWKALLKSIITSLLTNSARSNI